MNFLRVLLFIVLIGITINMFYYDRDPDSLMKDSCECYSEARKLKNSDAFNDKMKECEKLMFAVNEKLRKQAKEEDWPDEKANKIADELYAKYCGNDHKISGSDEVQSSDIPSSPVVTTPSNESSIQSDPNEDLDFLIEKNNILDVLSANFLKLYNQKVLLKTYVYNNDNGFAWVQANIERTDFKPLKYDPDTQDCCHLEALLQKENNKWKILEFSAFSSDAWWYGLNDKYSNLPKSLIH